MKDAAMTEAHPPGAQPAAVAPLWRRYLAFLGPMIFSNFLQSVSGTVNNIYLGQMLGVKAMAAVSAFFLVLFFLITFMIGLGSGASVLIGHEAVMLKPASISPVVSASQAPVALWVNIRVSTPSGFSTRRHSVKIAAMRS